MINNARILLAPPNWPHALGRGYTLNCRMWGGIRKFMWFVYPVSPRHLGRRARALPNQTYHTVRRRGAEEHTTPPPIKSIARPLILLHTPQTHNNNNNNTHDCEASGFTKEGGVIVLKVEIKIKNRCNTLAETLWSRQT